MKRTLVLFAIVIALAVWCAPTLSGQVAHAASEYMYEFESGGDTLYMQNVADEQERVIGVSFSGSYFGDIPVTMEVYAVGDKPLDFNIGGTLTSEQRALREDLADMFGRIHAFIERIDGLANTSYDGTDKPASDVYRYNNAEQGQRIEIARETYEMLCAAKEMYELTDGAFDPAVYRLVDLWGFSSRIYSRGEFGLPYDREVSAEEFFTNGMPLPEEKYIEAFSAAEFVDFSDSAVVLDTDGGYGVTKNVPPAVVDGVSFGQWIDLGGIAKGYVVDGIRDIFAEQGIDRFYVSAGGSSVAYGKDYDGTDSVLGIADAFDPMSALYATPLFSLEVGESSVSTSGQNVRKYTRDGVEYAHILDGETGAPAQTGVRSVTVIVPKEQGLDWATKGDCLTTALTVMGRDGIIRLINDYFDERGILVAVEYETADGRKQLLTNIPREAITAKADSFAEYGWALTATDNGFVYDANATGEQTAPRNTYRVWLIVLGCILGAAAVALVIYRLVKGGGRTLRNVRNARRDKPFKLGDILIYMGVVLLILVLFGVFVLGDTGKGDIQRVNVIDERTGEILFVYNTVRDEYTVNSTNSGGWQIEVEDISGGIRVTLYRTVDGEERYNQLTVMRGRDASVKMTDSVCGFHQDCVRNFPEIKRAGGVIVCSPNMLKVVTL